MSLFNWKKINFYSLLLNQAYKAEEGIKALTIYMKNPTAPQGQWVLRAEEEADALRKQTVDELNRAFVTPIDREDIFQLSRAIDDIVDYAKTTVEEMMAFKVKPNQHMIKMAEGLSEAATAIAKSISHLEEEPDQASESAVYAKKRENFVEHCYREALVELFQEKNVVNILKVREIYRHMSNAADRVDEAANIIGNIIVKSV